MKEQQLNLFAPYVHETHCHITGKELPKDLAGYQCIVVGMMQKDDLLICAESGDRQFATGSSGIPIENIHTHRVYRKMPVANHLDVADPKTKALIESAKAPAPTDKLAAIREERGKIYGESELSHENIGLAWTAAIQQHYGIRLPYPLKPWLVEQMMCQFKIQRATRVYHEDNYDDLSNYSRFAKEHQVKDPSAQLPKS